MITYIDFQGGTYGNFLEFVLNKFVANVITKNDTPFTSLGSSHAKEYISKKHFFANHYSFYKQNKMIGGKIITIQLEDDDLLPISMTSMLRAGDMAYDNNELEIDTYNKFNNSIYRGVLDSLIKNYFEGQVERSYMDVREKSWPLIKNLNDYNNLPIEIRDKCERVHKLKLYELTEDMPHCPRSILRDYFKHSFKHPCNSIFMSVQKTMVYDKSSDVYIFKFSKFYDTNEFINEVKNIAEWLGYTNPIDISSCELLHKQFLSYQKYCQSKNICDRVIDNIIQNRNETIPKLDLMCESYIDAKLELYYNTEARMDDIWFDNTHEAYEYFTQNVC